MKRPSLCCLTTVLGFWLLASSAQAAFHVMQIEQVIGGVNGNNTAQAIQLRLRTTGQTVVSNASLWAADATGSNRILLLNIASNVSSGNTGDRVLLSTSAFNTAMTTGGNPTYTPDFTLASAIPASYLSAGRLTFEQDGGTVATPGTIYWSLAWGGAGYSGTNTGDPTNDADSNFGTPFGSALPTLTFGGVRFTGTAGAGSTTNVADYALSASPATVTKNSGTGFSVVPEPGTAGLFAIGALVLSSMAWSRRRRS
jgi:hypothetical protein